MLTQETSLLTEISEVFSSLQGEGLYLGKKQIFVRFGRCNMHCGYCDETAKMQEGAFKTVSLASLTDSVMQLEKQQGPVSLTGGEPLFYSKFLQSFLPRLKEQKFKIYLETNGTLPLVLKRHLPFVDIVAMDMKPPSTTGDRAFWKEHREFLKLAACKDVFVKVVVTPAISRDEVDRCVQMVREVDERIPFVFQPESELTGISVKALQYIEEELMERASRVLKDVRVIPQMHKVWGIR